MATADFPKVQLIVRTTELDAESKLCWNAAVNRAAWLVDTNAASKNVKLVSIRAKHDLESAIVRVYVRNCKRWNCGSGVCFWVQLIDSLCQDSTCSFHL